MKAYATSKDNCRSQHPKKIINRIGIIFNIAVRLAATFLGTMIFIWVLILHIPRAIADPSGRMGNEWTGVLEALAFSGIAFILGRRGVSDLDVPYGSPNHTVMFTRLRAL